MRSEAFFICFRDAYTIFPHTGAKVPHPGPAPKRNYGIFGIAFGSGVNLHELWAG